MHNLYYISIIVCVSVIFKLDTNTVLLLSDLLLYTSHTYFEICAIYEFYFKLMERTMCLKNYYR